MLKGLGIDIVQISRLEKVLDRWQDRFLKRIFTQGEIDYSLKKHRPARQLSARFACKEAVAKALGYGFTCGVSWTDIEVVNDSKNKPNVLLHGKTGQLAEKIGVQKVLVSLSHDGDYAIASISLI